MAAKKESNVDVLIVGAGPAGLMMATWLAKCGVQTRIVDKRGTKIFNGQADGLQCRTLEIFDSLGFGDRTWKESNHMLEIRLWNPDDQGVIRLSDTIPDTIPGISRFQQVVLHQGRIERFFLDAIAECGGNPVERGVMPTALSIDESQVEDPKAYPVTVTLRHLSEEEATPQQSSTSSNGAAIQDGLFRSNLTADDTHELLKVSELNSKANQEEVVHAKYMLGADGAHSWVRNQLGFKLEGDSTDYIWGVLDIVPITDFPDIRMRCAIHSASSGSVMVIPRENKLVRLYIQLTTTERIGEGGAKADRSKITPETILESAQRIMAPYKITYRKLDWWTAYQIGQRVGQSFSAHERVFLAGDAVHTHSPKAGQGMNVSMQDAFNLGWKVASVVQGTCDRSILKTYQSERRRIAQDLIDFDRKFSRLFSGRPAKDVMDAEGISMDEFKDAFEKGNMFASGIAVNYGASTIVAKEGSTEDQGDGTDVGVSEKFHVRSVQELATGIEVGKRIPSTKVLNQSDARPWHFQELLPSNGRWRVIFFTGDISQSEQKKKLENIGQAINDKASFYRRFTPPAARHDTVFEILAIHTASRKATTIFDFPEVFRNYDEVEGWDYSKIYVDEESYHEDHGEIYKTFGISEKGCAVILRPDQIHAFAESGWRGSAGFGGDAFVKEDGAQSCHGCPTTGGHNGKIFTVTTDAAALNDNSTSKIIYINGTFNPTTRLAIGSNMSLIGKGKGANIIGKGLNIYNSTNVIVRNIGIRFVVDGDGMTIQNSTRVWVDHCEFESEFSVEIGPDYYDGQLDIVRVSDWITVSYNYFHDHWKSSLVGNSDVLRSVDEGHLHITYHHNFWSNIGTRGPAGRFGHQHIYNSLYEDYLYQAIHSRSDNQVLVEGNVFKGSTGTALSTYGVVIPEDSPNTCVCGDEEIDGFANLGAKNDFGHAAVNITQVGNFTSPGYRYKLTALENVEEFVKKSAGLGIIT